MKNAEAVVASLRSGEPSLSARLLLAKALLEMADVLEELDMPPVPGSEGLERALDSVSEVADEIGASSEPMLDDVVLEALTSRSRLLMMLSRPQEARATTASIRARVGDDEQQLQRAERLYAEASDAYDLIEGDPEAALVAGNAIERLGAPYADAAPPPPDAVVPHLVAAATLIAGIAIYHGQPDPARAFPDECLDRFGDHPNSDVQIQLEYAQQLLDELDGGGAAPR